MGKWYKIGQTVTVNRSPHAMKVSCKLVASIYPLTFMQVQTCFGATVILHTAHDATKDCEVYAISIDVSVGLFIAVCSWRRCLPDLEGNKTGWLIKSWDCKFVGNLLVL